MWDYSATAWYLYTHVFTHLIGRGYVVRAPTHQGESHVNKTSYRFGEALHTKLLVNRLLNEKGGIKKDTYSFYTNSKLIVLNLS